MMRKEVMIAAVLMVSLIFMSSVVDVARSDAFDCNDACTTACVLPDPRESARCNAKCGIRCGPASKLEDNLG